MVESIITVVLEVVKCLAPPTERQISYLRSYNNNFENLKKKIDELKGHKASVQHKVDEAKRQGDDIEQVVDKWIDSVDKVIVVAEELVGIQEATTNNRCFKGLCPNLKARLRLSKNAVRQLEAISECREAEIFQSISHSPVLDDMPSWSSKDYEAFESRKSTLNSVLGALKDADVYMLGIYGMGGIGKTTLVKEVAMQVQSEFDQVVFAEVSQIQDIRKIQGEIADQLGLSLRGESEPGRARSLCKRLMNEKRILVILDNIWEELDLRAVGIPHGDDHKGCKVLLMTRSENVLSEKMDSQPNFQVGVLEEEEAWSLFKKMAGDSVEGSEFKSVAREVAKKCAGLPVSIVTVARGLRNKRLFEWEDALEQLSNPSSEDFQDIQSNAYSAIKLSYNKLGNEKMKKIFLLIAYAHLESVDGLLIYGMGLDLFEGINNMKKRRARVRTLVRKLKDSCMLLNHRSDDEERFSIHDVVHDVAISIASREQNVLSIANGELPNRWESSYTSIFLHDVKTNSLLPEELNSPQLNSFRMVAAKTSSSSLTIPDNFFAKIKQVRVIDLTYMRLLPLPSSLGLLTNLQTLCLYGCNLQDIAVIGNFKKLEILRLRDFEIKQLPEEVGHLTQLKLLDLRWCLRLQVIPSNVLSKLSCLEELYIDGFSFQKWGVEVVEGQKNATLDELLHLRNLTSLELLIDDDVSTLPSGLFFEKLERFAIRIGSRWRYSIIKPSRVFQLDLSKTDICLKDGLIVPLKGVEALYLRGLQDQDVNYLVHEFVNVGSLQLKDLDVNGCDAPNSEMQKESVIEVRSNVIISDDDSLFIEKVAIPNLESLSLSSINVERIWQSQLAAMYCGVQNLTNLAVYDCRNLKSLFSEDVHIEFPTLKELTIKECPEFMVKYKSSNHGLTKKVREGSITDVESNKIIYDDDSLLIEKVAMPNLESMYLYSLKVERIWQSQLAAMSCGVQSLISLEVEACENLKCLFSTSILGGFVRLQKLTIKSCPYLEELIVMDDTETKNLIFPRLQFLEMEDLEKLTCFSAGDVSIEFPSLKELTISGCPEFTMKYKNSYHDLTKKVWVPNLDCLRVEERDLSWIFQCPEGFIRKLKYLDIIFEDESTIIQSLDFLKRFHILNFLVIAGNIVDRNVDENGFMTVIRKDRKFYDMKSILQPSAIFNDLETLDFWCLESDNVMILVPSSITFHNLTTLALNYCEGFIKLLTSSTAKSLVRLREMSIKYSNSITEIVTDDEGEDAAKEEIIFRELKKLELFYLINLTSFYSGNCSLKFPSLETLVVDECRSMKIFFGGELDTPKLHKVQLDRWIERLWIWEGDLNTSIQRRHLKTEEAESSGVKNSEED